MRFFAIIHHPTKQFFPYLRNGSSNFNFSQEPLTSGKLRKRANFPPRLFSARRFALRYITEYCKGIRDVDAIAINNEVNYIPVPSRKISDFSIVPVNVTIVPEGDSDEAQANH